MAEVETYNEDVMSGNFSTSDDKEDDLVVLDEKQQEQESVDDILIPPIPTGPLVDIEPEKEPEESTEVLTATTPVTPPLSGVEEVNLPDNQDMDEAIVDGFPAQTKPQMNGSTTATTPSLPTPASVAQEGFEELDTGIDDKPPTDRRQKDGTLRSPLALWIMKQNLHPEVVRLVYWVDLQRTTGFCGGMLLLLLSLRFYSLIGVVMTFALSLLVVAFLYRIGMTIVKAVQKTSAEHPFKHLLEEKIEISEEAMQYWSSKTRRCINEGIRQMQCLFLVKDTVASLKAMIMFWLVSYIASCIDFLSICILGTVLLFTVPKLYEEKQSEIDQLYSLAKEKICLACGMIEEKLPEKVKAYLKKTKSE